LKNECIFLDIWEFQSSERVKIKISRMLYPKEEKEFFQNQNYLKNLETEKEFETNNPKRIKIKTDNEKYYVNSLITGYDGNPFRTKGFSILRNQLPHLIESLQNICDGGYDSFVNNIINESYLPNSKKSVPNNLESDSSSDKKLSAAGQKISDTLKNGPTKNIELTASKPKTDDEIFTDWKSSLSKEHQKEIEGLIKSGWTKEEAKIAFEAKYS
jgi:hypothetical protein